VWNSPLKTISRLDCPESEDGVTRHSVASDGRTCEYRDDQGNQIVLELVDISNGDIKASLAPVEAQLRGELPPPSSGGGASASTNGAGGNDRVDIDLPGIHIHANGHDNDNGKDSGGHGSVQINGGAGDNAVSTETNSTTVSADKGGVTINAGDNGAQVSVSDDAHGVRRYFMLASDTPGPNGYRMVAYDARGPAKGPLAVALVMAKSDDHDDLSDAARSLLKHNIGG
jgi:hypothetical protein